MMQKTISSLLRKLQENADGTLQGGFGSIRGGFNTDPVQDNGGQCNNTGTCTSTNVVGCTNPGDCSKATNSLGCSNTGTCFA